MPRLSILTLLLSAIAIPGTAHALEVGEKAPDFELSDAHGRTFRLSSFKRKILTVFYEGSTSRGQNAWLKAQYRQLRRSGKIDRRLVQTIAVANFKESALPDSVIRAAIRFRTDKKKTVLLDEHGHLMRKWGLRNGRSNIYVFDQERRLVWKSTGPLTKAQARRFLRFLRRLAARR